MFAYARSHATLTIWCLAHSVSWSIRFSWGLFSLIINVHEWIYLLSELNTILTCTLDRVWGFHFEECSNRNIFSDLYLASCGRKVDQLKWEESSKKKKVCMHGNHFLVFNKKRPKQARDYLLCWLLGFFRSDCRGLSFTVERNADNSLRFLDLELTLQANLICLSYLGLLPRNRALPCLLS